MRERREAANARAARILEIETWLRFMHPGPGAIAELRAPKIPDGGYEVTASGLYDFDHVHEMAVSAYELTTTGIARGKRTTSPAPAVYFTLNPVSKSILALHPNQTEVAKSDAATDKDIDSRGLILIDVDATRKAGIGSTDQEKDAARFVLDNVRSFLIESGWPDPVVVDSGNGWHLYFKVDIPTADGELVKNILHALATRFNTESATVDTSVFNPSRISKIPGTMSRKGHSTPDRPYRYAKVESYPETFDIVPAEKLEALAAEWKAEQEKSKAARGGKSAQGSPSTNKTAVVVSSAKPQPKPFIEKRAAAYLEKTPPAVEGQAGSIQTMHAAGVLKGFAIPQDAAFDLLEVWNRRCEPPWSESDLLRKIDEVYKDDSKYEWGQLLKNDESNGNNSGDSWADGVPDNAVVNGIPGKGEDKKGNPTDITIPIEMSNILARIDRAGNGWPCRIEGRLFFHNVGTDDRVRYFEKPDALFGWLGLISKCGTPRFYNQVGCHSKGEVFTTLQDTATQYKAIETVPHEPPIDGHYYACEHLQSGDGVALEKLLDFFCPETDIDRDLIKAMFATAIWGGPGGSRPMFVITSGAGRGAGKTTLASMVGEISGGFMSFSPGVEAEEIMKRLLSPAAATKRVAIIDNLKTHRFSWAELESMITATDLSGRQLYTGEGTRPNTLTWIATLNGVSLSTDIAQRSVIIRIKRPVHSGDWAEATLGFIKQNRKAILSDLIGFLRGPADTLSKANRWGAWEKAIVARLPEPSDTQAVISDRMKASDAEDEEGDIVLDYIRKKIDKYYPPETAAYDMVISSPQKVFIPSSVLATWYREATGDHRVSVTSVSRIFKQRIEAGSIHSMTVCSNRVNGRGFIWWPWKVLYTEDGDKYLNMEVVDEQGNYLEEVSNKPPKTDLEEKMAGKF